MALKDESSPITLKSPQVLDHVVILGDTSEIQYTILCTWRVKYMHIVCLRRHSEHCKQSFSPCLALSVCFS